MTGYYLIMACLFSGFSAYMFLEARRTGHGGAWFVFGLNIIACASFVLALVTSQ